jgi:hypothetical protein
MSVEILLFLFENSSTEITNEACGYGILLSFFLGVSQLGKGVDNDTKDNIQRDNINEHEESNLNCPFYPPFALIFSFVIIRKHYVSNTSSISQTGGYHLEVTTGKRLAVEDVIRGS